MNTGLNRFTFYTNQISDLLDKAREQESPALWLFTNKARTPFFMLEALARLYADMHNPKKFNKLKEQCKLIEDGLGKIDHYHTLHAEFLKNKKIPANFKHYIKLQLDLSIEHLDEVLEDKGWISRNNKRIEKIHSKLDEIRWFDPEEEVEAISDIYELSIDDLIEFVTEIDFHFDNIEEDVHELRRKLRWLSIYPQALQGAVQYSKGRMTAPHLKKYHTKEIVNSPFNKFPPVGTNSSLVLVNKNYYLALSWIIAELGKLKDEGLLITGVAEAIKQGATGREDEILSEAEALLGRKQRKMQVILDEAEAITRIFFREGNLQQLLVS